jgi:hypothetical protein
MGINIRKLLEGFGLAGGAETDEDGVQIELGPGIVGLTTVAVIVALVVVACCAYFLAKFPLLLAGIVGTIAFLLLIYLFGTWIFAHKHPDLALLGGGKLLQYRKMQMAAANPSIMLDTTPTKAPLLETKSPADQVGPNA